MKPSRLFLIVFFLWVAQPLVSQVELAQISTASSHPILVPDAPDFTFAVRMDPDGIHAWVSVCGALSFGTSGTQNNQIIKINVQTLGILGRAIVGFYPEDIALHLDPSGQTDRVYVVNSSSSSVSVLTPGMSSLGTLPLPTCGANGSYPFQCVFSADGNSLFVGSLGCGDVFVVNTDATSPNYHSVQVLVNYNGLHGALLVHPAAPNVLLAGSSVEFGGYLGAQATLDFIDTGTNPPTVQVFPIGSQALGDYAALTDIVALDSDHVLLVESSQVSARLHVFRLSTQTLTRTYNLGQQVPGLAFLHQAALHPNGRILAVTSLLEDVVFFDLGSANLISHLHFPVGVPTPNDVAFTSDGQRLVVTFQNEETVRIYGQLPEPLDLTLVGSPALGGTITLQTNNGTPFGIQALVYSTLGGGPAFVSGWHVHLTPPFGILTYPVSNATGQSVTSLQIPNFPPLVGLRVDLQAFTTTPTFRFSGPLTFSVLP